MPHELIADDKFILPAELKNAKSSSISVSIFGPQSSGKSTLLNDLFKTEFETLRLTTPKVETTKGVLFDMADQFLIFDIEGCDSVEREFEDEHVNEKFAAFACAIGDIFIVNMWEHDVGRWQASGYAILSKVFSVYQRSLKGKRGPIRLIFCIRDAKDNGTEEREAEIVRLQSDVDEIWNKQNTQTNFEECFELEFAFLPHREYESAAYEEAVRLLRASVANQKPALDVPHEVLGEHLEKIWSIIQDNEDLDLEREKELMFELKFTRDLELMTTKFEKLCNELCQKPKFATFELTQTHNIEKCQQRCKFGEFIEWITFGTFEQLESAQKEALQQAEDASVRISHDFKSEAMQEFEAQLEHARAVANDAYDQAASAAIKECFREFHDNLLMVLLAEELNEAYILDSSLLGAFSEARICYSCLAVYFEEQDASETLSVFQMYESVARMTIKLLSGADMDICAARAEFDDFVGVERDIFAKDVLASFQKAQEARFIDEVEAQVILLVEALTPQFYVALTDFREEIVKKYAKGIFDILESKGVTFSGECVDLEFTAPKIHPEKHLTRRFDSVIQTAVQTSMEVYLPEAIRTALNHISADEAMQRVNAFEAGMLSERQINNLVLPQLEITVSAQVIEHGIDLIREFSERAAENRAGAIPLVVWVVLAFAARNDIKYVFAHKLLLYAVIIVVGVIIIENQRGRSLYDYASRFKDGCKASASALSAGRYEDVAAELRKLKDLCIAYFA